MTLKEFYRALRFLGYAVLLGVAWAFTVGSIGLMFRGEASGWDRIGSAFTALFIWGFAWSLWKDIDKR